MSLIISMIYIFFIFPRNLGLNFPKITFAIIEVPVNSTWVILGLD